MRYFLLLFCSWLCVGVAHAVRETMTFPHLVEPIIIEGPSEEKAGEKYPVIFYYHGTSGRPTTQLISHVVGGSEECYLIGMAYTKRGLLQVHGEEVKNEMKSYQTVRDALLKRFPIDQKRIFVSGFSKGGWISAFLLESQKDIAGAMPLGAGALSRMPYLDEEAAQGKPVYIGCGILDENYINSARLEQRFKKLKAKVLFDQWDLTGHDFPKHGAPALRQWIRVYVFQERLGKEGWKDWASNYYKKVSQLEDLRLRYLRCLRMKEMPYVKALGSSGLRTIERELNRLGKTGVGGVEAKAWLNFESQIQQELRERKVSDLQRYRRNHLRNANTKSHTSIYAKASVKRLGDVLRAAGESLE